MSDAAKSASWRKRFLCIAAGLFPFWLLLVVSIRVPVMGMFRGMASSKATGLSAVSYWDSSSMWSAGICLPLLLKGVSGGESWIARSADLRTHSSSFERSVVSLHPIVSARHGYFKDLRTESRSGFGRALAAALAVPSEEFDAALADLQTLGRVEAVSQAGEDSAVKLATAARRLTAAQTNLSRLQKLQRERKGELRDAVALEKDSAQAGESVAEAERLEESLHSTVAQGHIRFTLVEDHRAPLQVRLARASFETGNSLAEGIGAIFPTVSLFLSVLLSDGLPLLFWLALLFWPARILYRHLPRQLDIIARTALPIDIGKWSPTFPVTSPYVRVRIRRFGGLS